MKERTKGSADSQATQTGDYYQQTMARSKTNCVEAVTTMRRFVEEAERAIKDDSSSPERLIERVIHHFAWGSANAFSSIVSAIAALEDARKIKAEMDSEVKS